MTPVFPDGLSDFVREVVRLPQARGLFRTAYAAGPDTAPGSRTGAVAHRRHRARRCARPGNPVGLRAFAGP